MAGGKTGSREISTPPLQHQNRRMIATIESSADLRERSARKLAADIHSNGAWLSDRINPASPGYFCSCEAKLIGNRADNSSD